MRFSLREICDAVGGNLHGADLTVDGVSTDSRSDVAGRLFVPIVGPNFDGHDHIDEAISKGAVCALTEREPDGQLFPLIKVESTRQALMDLASYDRQRFAGQVAAVTGSAGKTTTKDMIASVLSQKYKTLKTQGNLNNDIGLPLTLLAREPDHEAMILEMGMNHMGEISVLSRIGCPDIAMITNIGDAHIENLGSRENILKAKSEIFEGLGSGGTAILNGDDPLLMSIPAEDFEKRGVGVIYCRRKDADSPVQIKYDHLQKGDMAVLDADGKTISYSPKFEQKGSFIGFTPYGLEAAEAPTGDWVHATMVIPKGMRGTSFSVAWHIDGIPEWGSGNAQVEIPVPGSHMVMNALLAFATGLKMGLNVWQICKGIKSFTPSGNRMAITEVGGMTIVNDTYNASPSSMEATIDMLAETKSATGRNVCILGDMFELGEHSTSMHAEVGQHAANRGIDLLITIGKDSAAMHGAFVESAGESGNALHYPDKASFLREWELGVDSKIKLRPGDTVLVKASRGMALEEIVEIISKGR